jgi:hypothetical protein
LACNDGFVRLPCHERESVRRNQAPIGHANPKTAPASHFGISVFFICLFRFIAELSLGERSAAERRVTSASVFEALAVSLCELRAFAGHGVLVSHRFATA